MKISRFRSALAAFVMVVGLGGCSGGDSATSSTSSTNGNSAPPAQTPPGDTTAPAAPTNVSANPVSSSQINVTWTASTSSDVMGYRISRYRNGALIDTVSVNAGSSSHAHAGLSASTTYSYRIAAFDAAANVSTQTAAVSATTLSDAPPPNGTLYFYDDFDGSFGQQTGVTWGEGVRTTVAVPSYPNGSCAITTSGNALRFAYQAAADGADSFAEQRLALTENATDIWIKFDLFIPCNYVHRSQADGGVNNKFFAIYRDPYGVPGFQVNFSLSPNVGNDRSELELHYYYNGVEQGIITTNDSDLSPPDFVLPDFIVVGQDRGRWHRIVLRVKVPTGDNTNDGVMQLWKNGTQFVNITRLNSWGGTNANYIDEAYILGWANSGFAQETVFYVDDIIISNISIAP